MANKLTHDTKPLSLTPTWTHTTEAGGEGAAPEDEEAAPEALPDEPVAETIDTPVNNAEATESEAPVADNDELADEDIEAEIEAEAAETETVDVANDAVDEDFLEEFEDMDDEDVDEGDLEDFEKEMEGME